MLETCRVSVSLSSFSPRGRRLRGVLQVRRQSGAGAVRGGGPDGQGRGDDRRLGRARSAEPAAPRVPTIGCAYMPTRARSRSRLPPTRRPAPSRPRDPRHAEAGYHVNTEFPIKLTLDAPPSGVTLAKTEWKAGGSSKDKGDADALDEQHLALSIKLTPAASGTYTMNGSFKFASAITTRASRRRSRSRSRWPRSSGGARDRRRARLRVLRRDAPTTDIRAASRATACLAPRRVWPSSWRRAARP